jgi:peptidylprolyl isomerase
VLLVIPPALGYGSGGNPDAGISGTDTLVFVVDILDAY